MHACHVKNKIQDTVRNAGPSGEQVRTDSTLGERGRGVTCTPSAPVHAAHIRDELLITKIKIASARERDAEAQGAQARRKRRRAGSAGAQKAQARRRAGSAGAQEAQGAQLTHRSHVPAFSVSPRACFELGALASPARARCSRNSSTRACNKGRGHTQDHGQRAYGHIRVHRAAQHACPTTSAATAHSAV